jgi:hypothetical protein
MPMARHGPLWGAWRPPEPLPRPPTCPTTYVLLSATLCANDTTVKHSFTAWRHHLLPQDGRSSDNKLGRSRLKYDDDARAPLRPLRKPFSRRLATQH